MLSSTFLCLFHLSRETLLIVHAKTDAICIAQHAIIDTEAINGTKTRLDLCFAAFDNRIEGDYTLVKYKIAVRPM